jgi:hypothetical protein
MRCTLETITPKKAALLLKKNTNNRPLSLAAIDDYAEAIMAGEWAVNGETIKMNGHAVVDGQNRLHAIIKADKPIETYVVRGLEGDKVFDTIDQGKRRTFGHVLARHGEKYYNHLSSSIKWLYWITSETPLGKHRMRNLQGLELLDANPELRASVEFISKTEIYSLCSIGLVAAIHHQAKIGHPRLADAFWEAVGTGENINKSHPAHLLRHMLIANKGSQRKLQRLALAATCIIAWNAFVDKKPLKAIKWAPDQGFPKVR